VLKGICRANRFVVGRRGGDVRATSCYDVVGGSVRAFALCGRTFHQFVGDTAIFWPGFGKWVTVIKGTIFSLVRVPAAGIVGRDRALS